MAAGKPDNIAPRLRRKFLGKEKIDRSDRRFATILHDGQEAGIKAFAGRISCDQQGLSFVIKKGIENGTHDSLPYWRSSGSKSSQHDVAKCARLVAQNSPNGRNEIEEQSARIRRMAEMTTDVFTFRDTHAFRELPGPQHASAYGSKIKHYVLLCHANTFPESISTSPNPRETNIKTKKYRQVRESLENSSDLAFHLKNKGITILADSVTENGCDIEVTLRREKQGIVDGGHTYKIIMESIKARRIPPNQYVKVEILTGILDSYISKISSALNTVQQVSDVSIADFEGDFDWIKEELSDELYAKEIKYHENDTGKIGIRDLIAFIYMFLPDKHGQPKEENPKPAYVQKAACFSHFKERKEEYEAMRPILKDILQLHDYILAHAREKYYQKMDGKGGSLPFMGKTLKPHPLLFTEATVDHLLEHGTFYPLFGAFRYLVEKDMETKMVRWTLGDFEKVKDFCGDVLGEMVQSTKDAYNSSAQNVNAVGKNDAHWANLHKTVKFAYLLKQG